MEIKVLSSGTEYGLEEQINGIIKQYDESKIKFQFSISLNDHRAIYSCLLIIGQPPHQ